MNHKIEGGIPIKNKFKEFIKRLFVAFLFILSIVLPVMVSYTIVSAKATSGTIYKPSKTITEDRIETLEAEGVDTKVGILLMGLDNDEIRDIGSTRADSLIYMVYDGERKELKMVSLPRDIYTDIYDGNGGTTHKAKINSAYTINEVDSTIETFKHYLKVPVDYYASVNFISFVQIIDAIGGITLDVPYDINKGFEKDNSGELLIPKGRQKLNGEEALIFSRIRKVDDDIQRGNRQQEVIKETIKSLLSINSLIKYKELLEVVEGNVETNLTFENLISLAGNMLYGFNLESLKYEWNIDTLPDGQSIVHMEETSYNELRTNILDAFNIEEYTP